MLFLLIKTLLPYQAFFQKNSLEDTFVLPLTFGFQKGGNYSIQIVKGTQKYLSLIGTSSEIDQFKQSDEMAKYKISDKYSICNPSLFSKFNHVNVITVTDGYGNSSGVIVKDGFYKTLIMPCTKFISNISFYTYYSNPNSKLSSNVQKYSQSLPIFIILISLLFLIWVINWIFNFSFRNYFHLLLTIYFIINIADKILSYFDLKSQSKSDINITPISSAYQKIHKFKLFISYMVTIVVVFGVSIVFNSNKTKYELLYFIPIIIFSILSSLSCIYMKNNFDDNSALTHIVFTYLFIFQLSFNSMTILHYITISNPLLIELNLFQCLVISTFVIYNLLICLNEFNFFYSPFKSFYLTNLSLDIFEVILLTFYSYVFRMRKETLITYSCVGEKLDIYLGKFNIRFCRKFNKIIVPSNIKTIEDYNYDFMNVESVEFDKNSQLETIGKKAFRFTNIKTITIPPSVEYIGKEAFSNCCKLQKVDFLEKSRIKYFESKIFEDSKIKSLYIPSSVITLKRFWCKDTKYLIDVKISPQNKNFSYYQNSYIIENANYQNYKNLVFAPRKITFAFIPSFIKQIAPCAFQFCQQMTRIDFSEDSNLVAIDSFAFAYTSIEEIIIPPTVVIIDDNAFYGCKKLKTVVLHPNSNLRIIGSKAFYNNLSLQNFSVPSNVIKIGKKAFYNCQNLNFFEISDDSMLVTFDKDIFSNKSTIILLAPHRFTQS